MSKTSSAVNDVKANAAFLLAGRPTAPVNSKIPVSEKRVSDPSAFTPRGRSYPIPAFFEYRAKPKEFDSL